jgi:hypothetical protein
MGGAFSFASCGCKDRRASGTALPTSTRASPIHLTGDTVIQDDRDYLAIAGSERRLRFMEALAFEAHELIATLPGMSRRQ